MQENSNIKKVRLSLMGGSGKVGTAIRKLAHDDPELEIVEEGDIIIDFSSPEGTQRAIQMNKPLVCGTTGLSPEIFSHLKQLSKRVAVLYAPNFSIGIALLSEMLTKARGIPNSFIKEIHGKQKKDTPSGTALKLAEILDIEPTHIQSERTGEVVAIHEVQFLLDDEILTLRHEAHSRKIFAQGAILAAKYLINKGPGFYSFKEVLLGGVVKLL